MEELSIFRFQFKKCEPCLLAALSFSEALSLVHKLPDFDESELVSVSLFNDFKIFV